MRSYLTYQIVSYLINSFGLLLENNNKITLDLQQIDYSNSGVIFSPTASYVILSNQLRLAEDILEGKHIEKVELYTRSDGKIFHTFPNSYSVSLTDDDEYAICITVGAEIQIWHLPSKNKPYTIEKYPLDKFRVETAISKKYIVLQHKTYIRVFSLQNKLTSISKEVFSISIIDQEIDIASSQYPCSRPLFYNEHTLVLVDLSNIYICDLDNNSNDRSIDLSKFGEIHQFNISTKQGLAIICFRARERDISLNNICLLDIKTLQILDSVTYRDDFHKIQFSTNGDKIIGSSYNQLYIWHIRQDKLCLIYRNASLLAFHDLDTTEAESDEGFKRIVSITDDYE